MNNKDFKIETLRGIAIILVVFTHVVGGLRFPSDSFWNYVSSSLQFLRMPLFTVISGYVYAYRPLTKGNELKFLRGKSRRLLITFFCLTPLFFIFRVIFPTNITPELNDIIYIYIYPKAGLWYLQALFIIFILVIILEYFEVLGTLTSWLTTLAFTFSLFLIHNFIPNEFSLRGTVYLLPYFLYGIGLNRFRKTIKGRRLNHFFVILFAISFSILQYNILTFFDGNTAYNYKFNIIPVVTVISFIFLLMRYSFSSKWFIKIGYYSYSIFLYHALFTVFARNVLKSLNIESPMILVLGCTLPGLFLPILLEYFLIKNSSLSLLFLGKSIASKQSKIVDDTSKTKNKIVFGGNLINLVRLKR